SPIRKPRRPSTPRGPPGPAARRSASTTGTCWCSGGSIRRASPGTGRACTGRGGRTGSGRPAPPRPRNPARGPPPARPAGGGGGPAGRGGGGVAERSPPYDEALFRQLVAAWKRGEIVEAPPAGTLEPLRPGDVTALPARGTKEHARLEALGEQLLREGKVAA